MSEQPSPQKPAEQQPPKPTAKVWKRRLVKTLVVIIVIAVTLRVIVFFAFGPVLRRVASVYGCDATYDRQELTIVSGELGLWGLKITAKNTGMPVLKAEYTRGRISVPQLLLGNLYVSRAVADGVDLTLERTADGSIPLLEHLLKQLKSTDASPTTQAPHEIDLTAPLRVEAFRLQHVRATIRDAAVTPALQATVAMEARVSNLGLPNVPTNIDVDVWSEQFLDSMRISGQGSSEGRMLKATANVAMRGLHPGPLAGYLAALGIKPVVTSISANLMAGVTTEPAPASSKGIQGAITLSNIEVTADEQKAFELNKLRINIDTLDTEAAKFGLISVDGMRVWLSRAPGTPVNFAGLTINDEPTSSSTVEVAPTTMPAAAPLAAPSLFAIYLTQIELKDIIATLHDTALSPAHDVQWIVSEIACRPSDDAKSTNSLYNITGAMASPGLCRSVDIKGVVKPLTEQRPLNLTFTAEGIRPDALKPYFSAVGIESLLNEGKLRGDVQAAVRINPVTGPSLDFRMNKLVFSDGGELIAMPDVNVTGVGIDNRTGRFHVSDIVLTGPTFDVTRDAEGRFTFANLRWTPGDLPGAESTAPAAPARPIIVNVASVPRVEISHFKWDGAKIHFIDVGMQPNNNIALGHASVEVKDFLFDLKSNQGAKPGSVRVEFDSPQLIKQFSIDGVLRPSDGKLTTTWAVRGSGINISAFAPYLNPLGFEPTMRDGSFSTDVTATVARRGNDVASSIQVLDANLSDGKQKLAGVDEFAVDDLSLGRSGIDIKSIRIKHPHTDVSLEADGWFSAFGTRIAKLAGTTRVSRPRLLALPALTLSELKLENAELGWADKRFDNLVKTAIHIDAEATNFSTVDKFPPGTFKKTARIDDVMDEFVVAGTYSANPKSAFLKATADARGVHGGPLVSYLPKGSTVGLKDGRFYAEIDARAEESSEGGYITAIDVSKVDWRDAGDKTPFFAFDRFHVAAPRIDPRGDVFAVDEILLEGLVSESRVNVDGSLAAMGLLVGKTIAPDRKPAKVRMVTTRPTTAPAEDMSTLVADARRPLPVMSLKKLDLEIRRAAVTDLTRPNSTPLALADVHLRNVAPIEMGGPNAETKPPAKFELAGHIDPLVPRFVVTADFAPMAPEPVANLDIVATGIRGDGVTNLLPELRDRVDGSRMTDGEFRAKAQAYMKFNRRGPRDFDLSRGFDIDATVTPVEFRDKPGGPVIAGLESIQMDNAQVEPNDGTIRVKSIEITKPIARFVRDADGIHAFGCVVRLKPVSEQATQPSESPLDAKEYKAILAAESQPPVQPPQEKPSGEIRIDRLVVTGLDVTYLDSAANPNFNAPLTGLDVEVRDITTLALSEERWIRFSAIVNAGKVTVPVRSKSAGLFAAQTAQPTTQASEKRDFFSQVATSGRVALYPKPHGYVKTSINGVELAPLKGVADELQVTLNDGIFDGDFDTRLNEDGSAYVRSKLVVTDLEMADPHGKAASLLGISMPFDVAIAAVEDPSGSITIPVSVPIEQGQISTWTITKACAGAVGSVMATAVLSSPVKVVTTLTGKPEKKPTPPMVIDFPAGSTVIEADKYQPLYDLVRDASRDKSIQLTVKHELAADVDLASARANPDAEDTLAMGRQLRLQKAALLQQRAQIAGSLQAGLVSMPAADVNKSLAELRATEQRIADTEAALDQIFDLLKPGADRQATRRTRAAALKIAQARLDAAAAVLQTDDIVNAKERVHIVGAQYNPSDANTGGGKIVITTVK